MKTNEMECRQAFKDSQVGELAQHIHHDQWLEVLIEPASNRIDFILSNKPEHEQSERLRLFRPLTDTDYARLPADFRKACTDYLKADAASASVSAYAAYATAYAAYDDAYAAYAAAYAAYDKASSSPEMIALHAAICGCQWSPSTDIFGKKRA
jgi:hypothetical protein